MLEAIVPLIQTVLWILVGLLIVLVFRNDLRLLREALHRRLNSGGSIALGRLPLGELRAEVRSVRDEVDKLSDTVARLFVVSMPPDMYVNLKKIASGEFGHYVMSEGLLRELSQLRMIGYIHPTPLSGIPPEGHDLTLYVAATEAGRQFVALREELQRLAEERVEGTKVDAQTTGWRRP